MKMNVYSVLDAKMGCFSSLWMDMTDESAIRGFSDGVNNPDPANKWFHHSEDFCLYRVGTFDQSNGDLVQVKTLSALVTASALKAVNSSTADLDQRDRGLKIK